MDQAMVPSERILRNASTLARIPAVVIQWLIAALLIGCSRSGPAVPDEEPVIASPALVISSGTEPRIVRWASVAELPKDVALLESVFWEPDDTRSLRQRIASEAFLKNADVLEVGTGSGLISLCCLQAGAVRVVATDLNPAAVQNALLNAKEMGFSDRFEVRLVPRRSPAAWTVIEPHARFDLIVSNPPWENSHPASVEQFALYDPDFELLKSLVTGAQSRLKPGGRMWLAYGCVTAIRRIQELAAQENLQCCLLDARSLDTLPELFLPGMLIEISVGQ